MNAPTITNAARAGILCNDPRFQQFVGVRLGLPAPANNSAAAEYIRDLCRIPSRRALDYNAAALDQFERIRTEFDAWSGRIAAPRD
ncbi:MAG: hypothetical protein HWE26_13805 [Alteromonadaceae bacterium]|nr:hypothetical protein [Alteromonadaceae bacterium]